MQERWIERGGRRENFAVTILSGVYEGRIVRVLEIDFSFSRRPDSSSNPPSSYFESVLGLFSTSLSQCFGTSGGEAGLHSISVFRAPILIFI